MNVYRIAEKNIKINSLHDSVHKYCIDYLTDGTPDFEVTTTQSDIDYERKKSADESIIEGKTPINYSDDYLEQLAVYRKIAVKMLDFNTFLFHGSAVAVDGQAYLFTAKSGTGKSTHTALWRKLFGERAIMVNDDKPLIRIDGSKVTVFGTPYNGKHRLGNNISAPLKAICILERAENNSIRQISSTGSLPMLIQQVYRPKEPKALLKTLELIDLLSQNVKLYRLGCNMDIEAARVSYEGMV